MTAAWEVAVRAWLVVAAWWALRRPARLRWLASIGHPGRFVSAAIAPAGRHFALAIAFLPRAQRDAATVTFLICKALDGFEDLSPDRAAARRDLLAATDYLMGRSLRPPRAAGLAAARPSDQLEALLAARLPLLRVALEALPVPAGARCRALIERIAAGMVRGEADRRRYADDVLGEAVAFAAEVAAPGHAPPMSACRAAGRALQLANDARDAAAPYARQIALYQALPELPVVPRLLRWLPASAGPGARAAATLVAITTCAFYARQVALPPIGPPPTDASPRPLPPQLRHPIRAAIVAAGSIQAYLATVATIEAVLRDAIAAVAGLPAPHGVATTAPTLPHGAATAASTVSTAPEPVASAAPLVELAMQLVHAVPAARLDASMLAAAGDTAAHAAGRAVVLSDYLLFAAVERLTELGPGAVGRVAALLEQLAAAPDPSAAAPAALVALAREVG